MSRLLLALVFWILNIQLLYQDFIAMKRFAINSDGIHYATTGLLNLFGHGIILAVTGYFSMSSPFKDSIWVWPALGYLVSISVQQAAKSNGLL